jgi:hypothetical protein
MKKFVSVSLVCVALIGFVLSASARLAAPQVGECTSTPQFGGGSAIDCIGACPTPATCDKYVSTYSGGTYEHCACTGGVPTSCCHLVLVHPNNGNAYFGVRGNCTSCGSQGLCMLLNDQAVCQ